eukprot:1393991-Amorphochlora_amoeboformis.AAC.2
MSISDSAVKLGMTTHRMYSSQKAELQSIHSVVGALGVYSRQTQCLSHPHQLPCMPRKSRPCESDHMKC